MSRQHILVDDMLDDLDSTDLYSSSATDEEYLASLDFPSIWDRMELHNTYGEAAERDRAAQVKRDERKLNRSANARRVREFRARQRATRI